MKNDRELSEGTSVVTNSPATMSAHAWGDNFQRDIVNLNFARLHDCVLGHNLLTPCIVRIANDFNHQYYVVPILLFHGATHDHPMMKKVEKDGSMRD
jgi:hypothetical protein